MSRYNLIENKFGKFDIIILSDSKTGESISIALQGATLLNYFLKINEQLFNIIDGFASPEELDSSRGARCWIMTPFANRISKGEYYFEGNLYKMDPIPPRNEVIHGFTSYECFDLKNVNINNDFIEAELFTDKLRPGANKGYPFAVDVTIKFRFEEKRLSISVTGDNIGENPAPFFSGWHPYFRTTDAGIDHLILTIDADKIILVDDKYIPLPGDSAYHKIEEFPNLNFSSNLKENERILGSRKLDNCYMYSNNGKIVSSVFDPGNGMKINLFQNSGVTLVFTGDTVSKRPRKSIALEPMQFITNAFNREELKEKIKILPGEKSVFEFGIEIS